MMEILTVMIVVGILATMAMPQYGKTVEQGYWHQAHAVLLTMYAGERSYHIRNGFYHGPMNPCTPGNVMADWRSNLMMDDPNECIAPERVNYTVGAPTLVGQAVSFWATRTGGVYNGNVLNITQDRIWGGNWGDPVNQMPP